MKLTASMLCFRSAVYVRVNISCFILFSRKSWQIWVSWSSSVHPYGKHWGSVCIYQASRQVITDIPQVRVVLFALTIMFSWLSSESIQIEKKVGYRLSHWTAEDIMWWHKLCFIKQIFFLLIICFLCHSLHRVFIQHHDA